MSEFSAEDYWKALILYGLNQATYKIALEKTLLVLCHEGHTQVPWETLSKEFLQQYIHRLTEREPMPQQATPARQTRMEQIINAHQTEKLSPEQAIVEVGTTAFGDVIHRFHNLGRDQSLQGKFYRFEFGKELELTDDLHKIAEANWSELEAELEARWSLLEGAFSIRQGSYSLANDLRLTYLEKGYKRMSLTSNIPFLQGYQGNSCFYCGEPIAPSDMHIDHVLPRQVIQHPDLEFKCFLIVSVMNRSRTSLLENTS